MKIGFQKIRMQILLLVDAALIALSVWIAYLLRFDFEIPTNLTFSLFYVMACYLFLTMICFYHYKIYKRIWQYASIGDLISICKSTGLSTLFFVAIHFFIIHPFVSSLVVPRSVIVLTTILIVLSVGGSRMGWRMVRDSYIKPKNRTYRALIVGAGDAGVMVVKEIKHSDSEFFPVGFVDDNREKKNREILGIPVLGNCSQIPALVEKYEIEYIILALPSASKTVIASILNICKQTDCQIKIMPRVNDLINGKITVNAIRDVNVEDLLGRDPVNVDLKGIAGYLTDHVVMVTGAGGSIGSELCRQIAAFKPKKLLLLGHGENSIFEIELELRRTFSELQIEPVIADIQHKHRLQDVFRTHRPHVVFHAAAHKHVPMMERNPIEAVKNNILGTHNVAECANEFECLRFVLISTDKAVNPTSVMGTTKRVAEMIVQHFDQISRTKYSAVRFGNVLGSRGSVIPLFKRQIEEGGPVTVTHPDMVRYFMTIPEAVQLVIQTGALSDGGEVFILDMGKPVKIVDLALDLIRLSGMEPGKDIQIVYSGIRPGEKLYEEILSMKEGAFATKHDRVFVSKPPIGQAGEMSSTLARLELLIAQSDEVDAEDIRRLLKQLVPTYTLPSEQREKPPEAIEEAKQASMQVVSALGHT